MLAHFCRPNSMNQSMGLIGIIDIVKTRMSAVGSHKKLTCHVAKLRAWPFDCGLKPPAVQWDRLSVSRPYKGQSSLVGSKDHQIQLGLLPLSASDRGAAAWMTCWSTDRLARWLLGWLGGYMTGWVNDWLATQVGNQLAAWLADWLVTAAAWVKVCVCVCGDGGGGGSDSIWTGPSRAWCRLFMLTYACLTQPHQTREKCRNWQKMAEARGEKVWAKGT